MTSEQGPNPGKIPPEETPGEVLGSKNNNLETISDEDRSRITQLESFEATDNIEADVKNFAQICSDTVSLDSFIKNGSSENIPANLAHYLLDQFRKNAILLDPEKYMGGNRDMADIVNHKSKTLLQSENALIDQLLRRLNIDITKVLPVTDSDPDRSAEIKKVPTTDSNDKQDEQQSPENIVDVIDDDEFPYNKEVVRNEEREPSKASEKASKESRHDAEDDADIGLVAETIDLFFDENGAPVSDLENIKKLFFDELHTKEIIPETTPEEAESISKYLQTMQSRMTEGFRTELEANPDTKREIYSALVEPVIRGHLTEEDMTSLVSKIDLFGANDSVAGSKVSSGYEGFMNYDPNTKTIRVAKEALSGKVKLENGATIRLDIRHMILHEVSHGLDSVISPDELLRRATEGKAELVDANEIAELKRIIESAKKGAVDGYLTMHSVNALSGLSNIEKDYDAFPEETKQRISSEQYEGIRLRNAVKEILTDYTAIYLKSDGSIEYFMRKAVDRTSKTEFDNFLIKAFRASDASKTLDANEARVKFADFNEKRANGEISDESLRTDYPEIYQMTKTLALFYGYIDKKVRAVKGKVELLVGDEGDDFDEFDLSAGGFESPSGFAQPEGSAGKSEAKGWLASAGELLESFSTEVNIMDPLTK